MNTHYTALLTAFEQHLQTLGFAGTTCYDYPHLVKTLVNYLQQNNINFITQVTPTILYNYYAHLEQKKSERTGEAFSTAHLNRIYAAVDKFLTFLYHSGALNTPAPTNYTVAHTRKKTLQVLTMDEVQQLYDAIPLTFSNFNFALKEPRQAAVKLVFDLCYGCGLRKTEAWKLKIEDVNFDKKIIHVKQGKNYKDRLVPMGNKVYEGLHNYIYNHHKAFNRRPAHLYPFSPKAMEAALKLTLLYSSEALQNKKPTLHTLRHSIATHLLQNGMGIENIARFLGHSTLESTKIYTHIITEL